MVFPAQMRMSNQTKVVNGALQTAQRELDQLRQNIFAPSGSFTDMDGNSLDTTCGGAPGTSCGNPVTTDGKIDFSAPPAVGYSVQLQDASAQQYSVRWNVTVTSNDGRRIILGSQAINAPGGFPSVVNIQSLVAR
jgi:hypothetical protein